MVVSSEVVHYDKDGAVVTIGWSGALDWMEECFCFSQRQTRPIKCSMAPFPFESECLNLAIKPKGAIHTGLKKRVWIPHARDAFLKTPE